MLVPTYNLGQYKMEQLSPIPPKAMMKARRSKKRAILASLKWGEGWSRCSFYFVYDCSYVYLTTIVLLCHFKARSNLSVDNHLTLRTVEDNSIIHRLKIVNSQ